MPISVQNISFNIDSWLAHSNGFSQSQDWDNWAISLQWPEETKLITSAIPPMMRRRMSNLSKLAVQTAIELLSEHQVDYLVFASRHGELQRSAALIKDIIQGEEASPMAFAQSVHNTAAGLATIATKKPIPLTSISAAENTFQSAILEAWLYLSDNPDHKVLVIDFDEPLPEPYTTFETQDYRGYGLGLVLSSGHQFAVSFSDNTEYHQATLPQGLEFVRQYLSNKRDWMIESPRQLGSWTRS
ncbi:3-oxoacyl-(acyl-carrier-protein) synthase [Vibrio orientalis CIP 102891 = ATCC 33934]|uniref:3-oxoacyl-(Acyl-carrier-protein) synthase n=1 Tax=Vibrio orientalis CIP 102891 = ATCC 33934 TaxID=675816 RepID=C9QG28_VIBOR|nr:beta-ketoacyl synthase chain length factor [Vibrio orientalis]EEX94529.1 3-oxoacyl-(acyl-carrier-protein) synthase [Vibrio orientalis CIP 102891 = ATCC 33934]EGU53919.1 3-oxoacyl-(acyl-carrier-protein) synthase [Vibrio orientalis CIP 102891 = ATCC 33934]